MLHLPPVKIWRVIGVGIGILCFCIKVFGKVDIHGPVAYHWGKDGNHSSFGGVGILWALFLLTFLSLFAHSGLAKSGPGQTPCRQEMACAISIAMMCGWTGVDAIIVIYSFFPSPTVPFAGVWSILAAFILCPLAAGIREKIHDGKRDSGKIKTSRDAAGPEKPGRLSRKP